MLVAGYKGGKAGCKVNCSCCSRRGDGWSQSSFGTNCTGRNMNQSPHIHSNPPSSALWPNSYLLIPCILNTQMVSIFFSPWVHPDVYADQCSTFCWRVRVKKEMNLYRNSATRGLELSVWYLDSSVLRLSEMKDNFRVVSWSCFDLWI